MNGGNTSVESGSHSAAQSAIQRGSAKAEEQRMVNGTSPDDFRCLRLSLCIIRARSKARGVK